MNGHSQLHLEQQGVQQNGVHPAADEGRTEDGDDADGDDGLDDDMMDKISSSPSIDDGVYNVPVYPDIGSSMRPAAVWSAVDARPATPLRPTPLDSEALDSPGLLESDGSSPFVDTPTHLPLQAKRGDSVRPREGSSYGGRRHAASRPNSPYNADDESSSSPFTSSPIYFPLIMAQNSRTSSRDHHRMGEYTIPEVKVEPPDEGFEDGNLPERHASPLAWRNHQLSHSGGDTALNHKATRSTQKGSLQPEQKLVKSASDIALENELLPIYDPLLEDDEATKIRVKRPSSPKLVLNIGWDTDSEDSFYIADNRSEFNISDYGNDDDPADFPTDPRFIDSGWGGECLRETEDIDFEFVYALHTFVATVEGQANATKGDTMVLLDDSNSYWWLVRVVKDSTIGMSTAEAVKGSSLCSGC